MYMYTNSTDTVHTCIHHYQYTCNLSVPANLKKNKKKYMYMYNREENHTCTRIVQKELMYMHVHK